MMNVIMDPTNTYTDVPKENIIEACGLIPAWIFEGYLLGETDMFESINTRYGYPMSNMTGGTVSDSETGIYKYPGDPALTPLVRWENDTQVVFMYQYAIMSFVDKATQEVRVTRVD